MSEIRPSKPFYVRGKDFFARIGHALRGVITGYNRRMARVYSPMLAAMTGTLLVLLIAVLLLFIPPYVGTADDGSLTSIMQGAGLGYRLQDLEDPAGAYAVRVYLHSRTVYQGISVHQLLIRAAIGLDNVFTRDNFFNLKYLAILYVLLYLPGVYLVFYGIVSRVKVASEATLLTVLGALVLGDGCTIAYFQSLYPEAVWQIALAYILGFCMLLQHAQARKTAAAFAGLAVAGSFLALAENCCSASGLVIALFCVRQVTMEEGSHQSRVFAVVSAAVILTASLFSLTFGMSRFTENSKLHAITNGVLLRSTNPQETLAEFGIEPRFETMTDMSVYADYPYTLSGQPDVVKDFLGKYNTGSIILHYIRHPFSFLSILDMGTQAAFQSVRSFVGNFEKSVGLPERSRNPLMIMYSNFKANSLPKTMWFLVILMGGYLVLFRRKRTIQRRKYQWTARERQIMIDTFACLFLTGVAHITLVILESGTSEFERYQALYGACINGMLLLFLAEILHRMNILSEEG